MRLMFSSTHMHTCAHTDRQTHTQYQREFSSRLKWSEAKVRDSKKVKKFSRASVSSLILCVFTLPRVCTEVTRIIQGRRSKARICGRLSAVLVHGVIRAGRPHPLCQQTVKHYSHHLLATIGSLRCKNIKTSENQSPLGWLWCGTLHEVRRNEPPRCWPSTFQPIVINMASKRARFVFLLPSKCFIKERAGPVMSIRDTSKSAQ